MSAPSKDAAAIRQVVRALKAAGHELLYVQYSDDDGENVQRATEQETVDAITAVDDAFLTVRLGYGRPEGWIRFVLGNGDPLDLIADHTTNLSAVIDPLMDSWS